MQTPLTLKEVLDRLYDSEINYSVTVEWTNEILVRLGDEMNGWDAETFVRTSAEAAEWLDREARRLHPESKYSTGFDPPAVPLP